MSENITVIDIVARVTDKTAEGAASATQNVSKLEQTMRKMQDELQKIQKMSKLELTMYAIDKASKGIESVMRKGREFGSKVWTATVSVLDNREAFIARSRWSRQSI